ncbi:YciI family protein [Euzebya pacifica]|jgi:hypothetical protein|uniref:YciI family protein n=1 Tax=Euzebya pacifica TaxID=1608957 RepID=UPI0030F5C20B
MKYLLMINTPTERNLTEEEGAAEMQAWFDYSAELGQSGAMLAGEALVDHDQAVTVDTRTGIVTDGPFSEGKEVIGGFYLIDVPDRDAALEWAKKIPPTVIVEVRQVAEFDMPDA